MIRLFDIFVSLIIIFFVSLPIFPFVLLKFIVDGFPVLYISKRVGLYGDEITVYKFRTMIDDPEKIESFLKNISQDDIFQKIPITAKIYTGIGRWFERLQLVELPQLYNVLRGDMSLVGNRPLPKHINLQLTDMFNENMINDRMSVLPGMTGVAQIIGKYGLSDQERITIEVDYAKFRIRSRQILSLYLNFLILLETFFLILTGKSTNTINKKIVSLLIM